MGRGEPDSSQIGLSSKLLSSGLYSAVAMMVRLTTLITPPLLRRLLVQKTPDRKPDDITGDYVMEAPMDRE